MRWNALLVLCLIAAVMACVSAPDLVRPLAEKEMGCDGGEPLVIELDPPGLDPVAPRMDRKTGPHRGLRYLATGCGELGRYFVPCYYTNPLSITETRCATFGEPVSGFLLSSVLRPAAAKELACDEASLTFSRIRTHQNFHFGAYGCGNSLRIELLWCVSADICEFRILERKISVDAGVAD